MTTSLQEQTTLLDLGSPLCQKCKLEIGSKSSIQAAGYLWHSNGCFTCSFCNNDISNSFVERFQRVFCVACDKRLFGRYCGEKLGDHNKCLTGCGKLIEDEYLETNNRLYHPSCLCCNNCKRSSSIAGELFIYNELLYCGICTRTIKKT